MSLLIDKEELKPGLPLTPGVFYAYAARFKVRPYACRALPEALSLDGNIPHSV